MKQISRNVANNLPDPDSVNDPLDDADEFQFTTPKVQDVNIQNGIDPSMTVDQALNHPFLYTMKTAQGQPNVVEYRIIDDISQGINLRGLSVSFDVSAEEKDVWVKQDFDFDGLAGPNAIRSYALDDEVPAERGDSTYSRFGARTHFYGDLKNGDDDEDAALSLAGAGAGRMRVIEGREVAWRAGKGQ